MSSESTTIDRLPNDYDFLTLGLFRTFSEINGDFGRKLHFFLLPCIKAPDDGFPLKLFNTGGT